jgi:hypothetical protein
LAKSWAEIEAAYRAIQFIVHTNWIKGLLVTVELQRRHTAATRHREESEGEGIHPRVYE